MRNRLVRFLSLAGSGMGMGASAIALASSLGIITDHGNLMPLWSAMLLGALAGIFVFHTTDREPA